MQIVETSDMGVRAAILHLRHPERPVDFRLFPMLHLGSPSYYQTVQRKLESCEVVVYEGVDSGLTRLLTLSYRMPARSKRLELVTQDEGLDLTGLRDRLLHGDVDARELEHAWARVPL